MRPTWTLSRSRKARIEKRGGGHDGRAGGERLRDDAARDRDRTDST
jgi:hypothetical protein